MVRAGDHGGRHDPRHRERAADAGFVYLAYALAIMLAIDPRLVSSVSFQLSATATWGVIVLAPALTAGISRALRLAEGHALVPLIEVGATATAAFASVLPVQARVFGNLPLAAIPTNILATPLYGATLLVAGIAALFGGIDAVADAIWSVGVLAPRPFVDLVSHLGGWGTIGFPASEPVLLAIASYAALLLATWLAQRQGRAPIEDGEPRRLAGGAGRHVPPALLAAAVLAAAVLSASSMTGTRAEPRVTVLDVGQGLAVLVRDGADAVLIDAGPPDGSALRALPRGVSRDLGALVVTHTDLDHAGGVEEVARRMRVARVLGAAPAPFEAETFDLGQRVNTGASSSIEVLSPPPGPLRMRESENDRSLVLLLTVGSQRILVAADIEAAAERWLVNTGRDLHAAALVVPHHGSRTSSTPAFIEAVAPSVAVISAGRDNRFGHPHPDVVSRYEAAGVSILNTADHGSITLTAHAGTLEVATER
ncbi:MAG: ComEC/Rec2 family competence protein [Dehalococcoidia bacterium]